MAKQRRYSGIHVYKLKDVYKSQYKDKTRKETTNEHTNPFTQLETLFSYNITPIIKRTK